MFQRIHRQLGPAGLIVAIVALVAALAGGAYAANHSGSAATASKAKPLTKAQILALIKSHPGPAGAAGTNGTNGTSGTSGKNGAPGAPGPKGDEGSPWTASGILPKGSSEKGTWSAPLVENAFHSISGVEPISFGIPLSSLPLAVEYIKEGQAGTEHKTECPGTVADPQAAEGYVCVYAETGTEQGTVTFAEGLPFVTGAMLIFEGGLAGLGPYGTWAVTAK